MASSEMRIGIVEMQKGGKMNDLISRQAAIDASCKDWCGCTYDDCPHNVKEYKYCDGCDTVVILENLPSAQPELIRRKDCKYYIYGQDEEQYYFRNSGIGELETFYCADAERKNNV